MPRLAPPIRAALRWLALTASGLLPSAVLGQGCPCGTIADEFRAADAGLVREWIVQVPFDSAGWRLERVAVGDGLVVAESGDGGLHAIRTGTAGAGTLAWSRRIPEAAGHAWPATIGTRLVMVASEVAVHAIDRDTGAVEWERPTASLTAAPAVQSGGWVYVPLATNSLLRLPANPLGGPVTAELQSGDTGAGKKQGKGTAPPAPPEKIDPVMIDAGGRFQCTPFPLEAGVLWTTDGGLSTLQRTALGWIRQRLPESPPPTWARPNPVAFAGPPAVRGREFYVALSNGALARVDLDAVDRPGLRTTWSTLLPDRAVAGPLVSGTVVVVSLGPSGAAAFATQDGRELWRSDLVGTLVATAGGRVWLHDVTGRLTALDLGTGSRRQSLCIGCFTLPVVNAFSERLVLASPGGLVVSLAPPPAVSAGGPPPREPAPADPAATPP